jgi:hypothetical protein
MAVELPAPGIGAFHVHRGHPFDGFEERDGLLVALCACGAALDTAEPAYAACPECDGAAGCLRCAGRGAVVDHAALVWRLSPAREGAR